MLPLKAPHRSGQPGQLWKCCTGCTAFYASRTFSSLWRNSEKIQSHTVSDRPLPQLSLLLNQESHHRFPWQEKHFQDRYGINIFSIEIKSNSHTKCTRPRQCKYTTASLQTASVQTNCVCPAEPRATAKCKLLSRRDFSISFTGTQEWRRKSSKVSLSHPGRVLFWKWNPRCCCRSLQKKPSPYSVWREPPFFFFQMCIISNHISQAEKKSHSFEDVTVRLFHSVLAYINARIIFPHHKDAQSNHLWAQSERSCGAKLFAPVLPTVPI